jgi:UDP:flavonoid glycosyltransferase YjiC (YdhE family)
LSSTTPELVRAVVARVRETGVRVIVAGTIHDVADLAGPDVFVGGILPSDRIMPEVDVAVVMGGQGSVQTAMASGTPIVGLPLHPEQELNVAIAVRHGMGLAVAPRRAETADVSKAVDRIAREPVFHAQARRVQALYAGLDGADRAAAEILRYLAGDVPDAVAPSPDITPALAGRSAPAERLTIQTGFSGR